jgi:signal transduction histidine kinase
MNLISTISQTTARRVICWHLVTVSIAGFGAGMVCIYKTSMSPIVLFGLVAVLALLGTSRFIQALGKALKWDRELEQLALANRAVTEDPATLPGTGGCVPLNPFEMRLSAGTSLADRGWNLLVEAGRRWAAITELEQSVAKNMVGDRRQSGLSLLDMLSDGVATIGNDNTISYANSAFAAMCGQESVSGVIGSTLAEALGADDITSEKLMSRCKELESSIEWKTCQGTRTLIGNRRPGRKSDGEAIASVWTFRDVTQQRLAESMRDQFLSAATHEFRTPLANIRAYAESLDVSEDIDTESRKKFFNIIQSESLRLSHLVDDLLDISRMQAGALALESHETDLGRLAEDVASKVQGEMEKKNIDFRCEFPPKFPKAPIDKGKLTAALVNLLGNAAKYTPDGGRVTFRIEVTPQKVKFIVNDTGIGIAPDELSKVFDRFFRSSDERVRDINGSGLGLALSQEVARLHGGEIIVSSVLNQGSSFCMDIPFESLVV